MKKEHVIRAWRDPEYRASLSAAERDRLPAHPAALIELDEARLGMAGGSPAGDPQPIPISYSYSTAIGSYGCDCICCV
jgi:mersacidin/lichenicidin family type 2 lantibiotic